MVKTYCGKKYGIKEYGAGFLIGALSGFFASYFIYGVLIINIVVAMAFGVVASRRYVNYLIEKRKKEFTEEFCDYLDAIGSSLSCGKNSYETFLIANNDVHSLYSSTSPICVESQRISNGLQSGRGIEELLLSFAARTGSEDALIFAEVFSICDRAGGNLKKTVNDTKATIIEKINIENEIKTSLAAPKNELNIMAVMPLVIAISLKLVGGGLALENSILISTIAVAIFVVSYVIGLQIVNIEV